MQLCLWFLHLLLSTFMCARYTPLLYNNFPCICTDVHLFGSNQAVITAQSLMILLFTLLRCKFFFLK